MIDRIRRVLPGLALVAVLAGAAGVSGQTAQGSFRPTGSTASVDTSKISRKWLDVAYAADSSTQKLDIYLPESGTGPFPVIIAIHGGAFKMGSRNSGELSPMLAGLARGYAVASVDYRLSGEALFPAAIQDVKAAIRFLRANAVKYMLDANRFAVWGGSAGGNLAAPAGTSGEVAELEGASGDKSVSSRVQAVVDWYGPIWFSSMDAEFAALGVTPKMGATSAPSSPESAYLGKTVGTAAAESLVAQASPRSYIDSRDPPFYIQHGDADGNIPFTQSADLAAALAKVIGAGKVRYELLPGAGHGGTAFTESANLDKIYAFLDQYLKP